MATLVMQGPKLTSSQAQEIAERLNARIESAQGHFRAHTNRTLDNALISSLCQEYHADINLLPDGFDSKAIRLLVTDMDSTLINIECIDEIADFANIKPQVAAITESAMRGEIDFPTSLRRRVALLANLDASALEHVYQERLQLNPGGEQMLAGLRSRDIKVALVSGGFNFFTERLQKRYALDYVRSNDLEIENGKLTGRIRGDIVGAEGKAEFLLELCSRLRIRPQQALAMGDGANDLLMLSRAGLSVAYHAKPKVQAQAHTAINYCGLEGVLGLLDISC